MNAKNSQIISTMEFLKYNLIVNLSVVISCMYFSVRIQSLNMTCFWAMILTRKVTLNGSTFLYLKYNKGDKLDSILSIM